MRGGILSAQRGCVRVSPVYVIYVLVDVVFLLLLLVIAFCTPTGSYFLALTIACFDIFPAVSLPYVKKATYPIASAFFFFFF